jgi:hypothetical protein
VLVSKLEPEGEHNMQLTVLLHHNGEAALQLIIYVSFVRSEGLDRGLVGVLVRHGHCEIFLIKGIMGSTAATLSVSEGEVEGVSSTAEDPPCFMEADIYAPRTISINIVTPS